jgi:tripartite ATP-independent transporter DctM subunit
MWWSGRRCRPQDAPRPAFADADIAPGAIAWKLATSFVPLFALIASVLGAILFGLATPHEAAGLGAAGAILLALIYRGLTWKGFTESVYLTARTTAMVCWLFVGSWLFSSVFSLLGGHHVIEQFFMGLDLTPIQFLLLAQLIIFLLGWPLEWTEIIIIFVPIFLPLLPAYGIDPILFGVLVALNIQTSFLTPPMAMSAYYLKGIAPPGVELMDIFRGIMPFLALVFVSMILFYMFPAIGLWLPEVIYGR